MKRNPVEISSRKLNERNLSNIIQALDNTDWSDLTDVDTNNSYNKFEDKLIEILDSYAPLRTYNVRPQNIISGPSIEEAF